MRKSVVWVLVCIAGGIGGLALMFGIMAHAASRASLNPLLLLRGLFYGFSLRMAAGLVSCMVLYGAVIWAMSSGIKRSVVWIEQRSALRPGSRPSVLIRLFVWAMALPVLFFLLRSFLPNIATRCLSAFQNPLDIEECFSPLRDDCMRVNCMYRHLENSRNPNVCEQVEEAQRSHHINPSYFVTRHDCLSRYTAIKEGGYYPGDTSPLRIMCSYERSEIAIEPPTPVSVSVKPGQHVALRYAWKPGPAPLKLQVLVRVYTRAGTLAFQESYNPPLPTTKWTTPIDYSHDLHIPASLTPGTYYVKATLWEPSTRMRAAVKFQDKTSDAYAEEFDMATLQVM